jgi:EmrB/QacA subfamily drug resistance transporter
MSQTVTQARAPGAWSHREILVVFVGLATAMLLAALDQTIVATALPTIVGELGGLSQLSWVVTAYLLTLTVSMPLYGKISDLYGRKRLFQFAIALFVAGSAACGLSASMSQLITFRAIQGFGAGGIMALTQTIVGDIVSPRERGRYLGYIGAVFAVASVAGPLLGGYIVDHLDWRWVFWINVPLGAVALAVTQRNLRLVIRRRRPQIDYLGAALLSAGVVGLLLALMWDGGRSPWASPVILGLAAAAAVALTAFVFAERRAAEPILPPELFRNRVFAVSSAIVFIVGSAMFATTTFLPFFLQAATGISATSSGLLLVPLVGGIFTTVVGSGRLVTRWGRYKVFPIVGTALLVVGMGLLSSMTAGTNRFQASTYMVVIGLGIGCIIQVIVTAVQNAVPMHHLGTATSAVQFFRSIGGMVGVAAFGALLNSRLALNLTDANLRLPAGSDPQSLLSTPEAIASASPAIQGALRGALADAITSVFLLAVPVMLVAFALSWLLRELPLRTTISAAPSPADVTEPA